MSGREVVIVGSERTPIGSLRGALAAVPAPRLGAADVDRCEIDEAFAEVAVASGRSPAPRPRKVNVRGGAVTLPPERLT